MHQEKSWFNPSAAGRTRPSWQAALGFSPANGAAYMDMNRYSGFNSAPTGWEVGAQRWISRCIRQSLPAEDQAAAQQASRIFTAIHNSSLRMGP